MEISNSVIKIILQDQPATDKSPVERGGEETSTAWGAVFRGQCVGGPRTSSHLSQLHPLTVLAFLRCASPWSMLLGLHLSTFSDNFSQSVPHRLREHVCRLVIPLSGKHRHVSISNSFLDPPTCALHMFIRVSPCRALTPLAERLSDRTS